MSTETVMIERNIHVLFHSEMKIFEQTKTSFKAGLSHETGISLVYFSNEELIAYMETYETYIEKDGYKIKKFIVVPMEMLVDILMIQKEKFNEEDYVAMRKYIWMELGKLIAEGNEKAIKTAIRWGTDIMEDIVDMEEVADDDLTVYELMKNPITHKRRRYTIHDHTEGYYFGDMFKYGTEIVELETEVEESEIVEFEPFEAVEKVPYVFVPVLTVKEIDVDEFESVCQSYVNSVMPSMKNVGRDFSDVEFNPMEMMRVKYHNELADLLGIGRSEEALTDILHYLEKSIKLSILDYDSIEGKERNFYIFEYGGKLSDLLLYKLTKR